MRGGRRVAAHGVTVAVGVLLAAGLSSRHAGGGSGVAVEAVRGAELASPARPVRQVGEAASEAAGPAGYATDRSEGYRAAWREVATRRVSRDERNAAQIELLKTWAEKDLAGALAAAVAEGPGNLDRLREAFDAVFQRQPEEAWRLIRNDDGLGPCAAVLRWEWETVLMKGPERERVVGRIREFPPMLRQQAIEDLGSECEQPEEYWRLLGVLAGGDDRQSAEQRLREAIWSQKSFRENAVPEDPAALARMWQGVPDGPERRRALVGWAEVMARAKPEDFSRAWQGVPAAEHGEALRVALESFTRESPAITGLLDQAVAAGQWDYLRDHGAEKMSHDGDFAGEVDFHALADWARTLPERAETVNLYRAAVDGWLRDEGRAVAWLEQMPAGDWHREQGYAALAQNALNVADEGLLKKAIAAITDPALKQEAQGNWDRARGR